MKTRLIQELDALGLNGRRNDPLSETKRILAKQKHCQRYALANQHAPSAILDAFERTTSTCESSAVYISIGARRLVQQRAFGRIGGRERHEAAVIEHGPWIKEARRLWGVNRALSILEVARRVKRNLILANSADTIRAAIAEHKPKRIYPPVA